MKAITENLALATVIALSLGLIRLKMYYEVFGIDILPYLDVSEIIQYQFSYLLILTGAAAFIALIAAGYFTSRDYKVDYRQGAFVTNDDSETIYFHIVISYILLIVGMTYFSGYYISTHEALDIIQGESAKEVTMITEKETIITDSVLVFAGKTKNNIYFYDKNKRQSRIFATGEIKEIRFRKGGDYRKDKD